MGIELKTQFWETIDTGKVNKIMIFLLIFYMADIIIGMFTGNWWLMLINTVPAALIGLMQISYNKYEGKEWKKKKQTE